MSDTSQAIDAKSLDALIASHIAAYGRSIGDTDPWLSHQLRDADDMTASMAHIAIDCFEGHDLLHDFPRRTTSVGGCSQIAKRRIIYVTSVEFIDLLADIEERNALRERAAGNHTPLKAPK